MHARTGRTGRITPRRRHSSTRRLDSLSHMEHRLSITQMRHTHADADFRSQRNQRRRGRAEGDAGGQRGARESRRGRGRAKGGADPEELDDVMSMVNAVMTVPRCGPHKVERDQHRGHYEDPPAEEGSAQRRDEHHAVRTAGVRGGGWSAEGTAGREGTVVTSSTQSALWSERVEGGFGAQGRVQDTEARCARSRVEVCG